MELIEAIKKAHAGKYKTINVDHCGNTAYYNQSEDFVYLEYLHARDFLHAKHPIIEKFLKRFRII